MKYLWNSKTDYHIHKSSASVPVHQLLFGWLDQGGWNRRCTRTFGGNEGCVYFGRQTSTNRRRLDVDGNNVLTDAVYVIRIRAAQDMVPKAFLRLYRMWKIQNTCRLASSVPHFCIPVWMRSESQPSILERKPYLKKSNSKHFYNRHSACIFTSHLHAKWRDQFRYHDQRRALVTAVLNFRVLLTHNLWILIYIGHLFC
jgi:hypothetical protein